MQPEHNLDNIQEPLRIIVFSASLRKDSFNTQLAELAAQLIEKKWRQDRKDDREK